MNTFKVWAPRAGSVAVLVGEGETPMAAGEDGWWSVDHPSAAPGSDYSYQIDQGDPLPDPRSPWQPFGVHGPSRLVDHSAFPWTDQGWQSAPLASAVIYELHTGTFTPEGTFEAVIDRLDHLVKLGITHIELMPVAEFPGKRGWGYDGVDLYAPHHALGGPEGLKRLVNACHNQGLGVILDVVYNHLGPSGNYLSQFGPYFTNRYATPWGEAVNFDGPGSEAVRQFFIENARMWLRDYHFDGLRLDAIHAIIDTSAVHFLEQLAAEIQRLERQLGRHLFVIAESDLNDPRVVRPPAAGGYGIDAQWSDDFHHALHTLLTGEQKGYYADFGGMAGLAKALQQVFVYNGAYSSYRERRHGRPAAGVPGYRFLAYLQNHDQIGNRAEGERSSQLMDSGALKIGAALVLASPFVPMLFQGEEWGAGTPFLYFTDFQDPDLAAAVRTGRQEEFAAFGWKPGEIPDPQAEETFRRSKLDWSELEKEPHAGLLAWHRLLIDLRRRTPALGAGGLDQVESRFNEQAGWFILQRGPVGVFCNLADQAQRLPGRNSERMRLLLASEPDVGISNTGAVLPPHSVAILENK